MFKLILTSVTLLALVVLVAPAWATPAAAAFAAADGWILSR